jgi:hypothetical protein
MDKCPKEERKKEKKRKIAHDLYAHALSFQKERLVLRSIVELD